MVERRRQVNSGNETRHYAYTNSNIRFTVTLVEDVGREGTIVKISILLVRRRVQTERGKDASITAWQIVFIEIQSFVGLETQNSSFFFIFL